MSAAIIPAGLDLIDGVTNVDAILLNNLLGLAKQFAPDLQAQSQPFLTAVDQTHFALQANTFIKLIAGASHSIYPITDLLTFALADTLDTGIILPGKDYYIYLCPDGQVKSSLNATWPQGYDANSRKIGGLHTLCVGAGVIAGHPLSGFVAGAILPQSVWCLNHKPKYASPAGMAFDPLSNLWWDIYLQSSTGGTSASAYGATITDTRVWNDHVADLAAVKKRLPFDGEFQLAAAGSNLKTNIVGLADPVTTGGHSDTAGRRMISNIGLEDMCGTMWQWLQDQSYRFDGAANHTHQVTVSGDPETVATGNPSGDVAPAWAYQDAGNNEGSVYKQGTYGDVKLLAGGYWSSGSFCGPRCRYASIFRWNANSGIGARGCAEPA